MRVYTCVFAGVVLAGFAAVVARDRGHARRLLLKKLKETASVDGEQDLPLEDFKEVLTEYPKAVVIWDGDY